MFKIGAIGAGHMGITILETIITLELAKPSDILVYELDHKRRQQVKSKGFVTAGNESEVYANAQLVMLAVPPQACDALFNKLASSAQRQDNKPVIISIMSGISSSYMRKYLGPDTAVITIMPTLGMKVGHGATAIAHTDNVPADVLTTVMNIFSATGEIMIVEEPLLKEIVAINGCMPGYAFYLIDAFARWGEFQGIDYRMAVRMAARGFAGAAALALEDVDLKELLNQVCTPGGLTAEGVAFFEEGNLPEILAEGMENTIRRGYELAK